MCSFEEGLVPRPSAQWASLGQPVIRSPPSQNSSHRGGASLPGPPLLRTTEPLTSLSSSQSAPSAPSASLKQPGFLEFPGAVPGHVISGSRC